MLGLHCYVGLSLVAMSGSYSLVVMHRLLIAVASLVVEHGLSCCHRTRCSIKEQDLDEAQEVETRVTASGSQEVQDTYLGSSICPSAPRRH